MNTQEYRSVKREMEKDAGKALAFFFVGLPLGLLFLAFLIL